MKTTRSTIYLGISLLVLALLIMLLLIPVLAKGIQGAVDNPTGPEKLDLRPIPVPVPAPPLVANQPPSSAIPAPSLLAMPPMPEAVLVPTPPVSAMLSATSLAKGQMPEPFVAVAIQVANQQDILAMKLICILLLSFVWLQRLPGLHSLTKENLC